MDIMIVATGAVAADVVVKLLLYHMLGIYVTIGLKSGL